MSNAIGAVIAALAIIALIVVGNLPHHEKPVPVPVAPAPVVKPVPAPAPVVRAPVKPKPVYHRVLPGGRLDGKIDCSQVPSVAREYPNQAADLARQYGVPEAVIQSYRVCIQ